MVPLRFAATDGVFHVGDRARRMFLVKAGIFNYGLSDRAMPTAASQLSDRSWISGTVLWTKGRHRGKLSAVTAGELITISPTVFVELMAINMRAWKFSRSYALGFIEVINMVPANALTVVIFNERFHLNIEKAWLASMGP